MLTIATNEVHLWFAHDASITDTSLLSRYQKLLSAEEQVQQKKFHFAQNRNQYLVTRALVRTVLCRYLPGIYPEQLVFIKNHYGKPSLDNTLLPILIEFNISHTNNMIVLAVTHGMQVGVDAEYYLRNNNVSSIVNSYFSQTEIQEYNSLEPHLQLERFFELWTLKEAYIKARGIGLSLPLDKISYRFYSNDKISISFDNKSIADDAKNWRFWQITTNSKHKISIALTEQNIHKKISLKMWKSTPLLTSYNINIPISRTG